MKVFLARTSLVNEPGQLIISLVICAETLPTFGYKFDNYTFDLHLEVSFSICGTRDRLYKHFALNRNFKISNF